MVKTFPDKYKTHMYVLHHEVFLKELRPENKYITKEVGVTEEKSFIQFYGMSSDAANVKHFGGLKDYRASEGREVLIPYRGEVSNTIQDILGGIRSSCTYAGAQRLKHLMRCATFIRCYDTHNRVYENN